MNDLTMEQRVERLERHNRRLEVGMVVLAMVVGGMVALVLSLVFLGATKWKPRMAPPTEAFGKVVRAQKFEVVDSNGAMRGIFDVLPDGNPGLVLVDKNGKTRASFSVLPDGSGLGLFDKEGKLRAGLGAVELEAGRTGATTRTVAYSLTFYDQDERVIWKAP